MTAHSCYNKPRHDAKASYRAQDGWLISGTVIIPDMVRIVTDFKPGCKYDKAATDNRCNGCSNRVA